MPDDPVSLKRSDLSEGANRCGCAICQGLFSTQESPDRLNDASVNVFSRVDGTASEQLIDGTPTNGANPFLDSLVWGGRWLSPYPGETTVISYHLASGDDPSEQLPEASFAWDRTSKNAITSAFQAWENVADIDFQSVTKREDADAWIWLGTNENAFENLGWSWVPTYSYGEPLFTVFNKEHPTWSAPGLAIGGYGYITAIHEIGHLLGLAHPHDGGVDGDLFPGVSSDFGDYGDYDLNQGIFTTMSYNDGWQAEYPNHAELGYGYQGTPMALDIEAIQLIYGANTSFKTGNDSYQLPKKNTAGTYWSCIWDAGGIDTISNAGSSAPCVIWLWDAGSFGFVDAGGIPSSALGIVGGFTIAKGVDIENAIGGSGNDEIYGNNLSNSLIAGDGNDSIYSFSGDDTIDGGNGADTVQFAGNFSAYTVEWSGNNLLFTDTAGNTDTVRNCETFEFDDGVKTLAQVSPEKDLSPPLFQSAATNVAGSIITLTYNEALGASGPTAKSFSIKVAGKSVKATAVVISGSTIDLTIPQTIKSSQAVEVSYKAGKSNVATTNLAIQDLAGNDAISVISSVVNNSTSDGTAPVLQSSTINVDRNKIILTYNEALGANVSSSKAFSIKVAGKSVTASSVQVVGSTVELSLPSPTLPSQAIVVGYKAPKPDSSLTNLAIQDAAGNDAISFNRTFTASAKESHLIKHLGLTNVHPTATSAAGAMPITRLDGFSTADSLQAIGPTAWQETLSSYDDSSKNLLINAHLVGVTGINQLNSFLHSVTDELN